ncbi:hypothetical protein EYD92_21805, partial [Shigella flexneri]|nr:hypothetical protein [Shigella flexneri]
MRAAYERVLRTSSEKTDSDEDVVTTFIIKSDSVPALWAGAAALFSYEGGALWLQFCAGQGFFWWLCLCVVTKVAPVG